jgi:hypothetical protein
MAVLSTQCCIAALYQAGLFGLVNERSRHVVVAGRNIGHSDFNIHTEVVRFR